MSCKVLTNANSWASDQLERVTSLIASLSDAAPEVSASSGILIGGSVV